MLHSVVFDPPDIQMRNDAIWYTFITHAEVNGMSVLRGNASDEEFKETVRLRRQGKPNHKLKGVLSFRCNAVRLSAATDSNGRKVGDRLYCVLDTDIAGRPSHADVFATLPLPYDKSVAKQAFRSQRKSLMDAIGNAIEKPSAFRNGILDDTQSVA